MKLILELTATAAVGAMVYGTIEIMKRGYSHISMGVLGAVSMLVIHELNGERRKGGIGMVSAAVISALFITSGELLAGEILNRRLDMDIWNYYSIPMNFDGQICLRYSLVWLMLSILGMGTDELMRRVIFHQQNSSAQR